MSSAVQAIGSDPLSAAAAAGDAESDAAGAGAESGSQTEPEFTDPLRRRTLQGDEGLGDVVGLSEDAMLQQEAQDAAAVAALADLPPATQGLQLYDRCAGHARIATATGMTFLLDGSQDGSLWAWLVVVGCFLSLAAEQGKAVLQLMVVDAVRLCLRVVQAARVPVHGLSQPTSWLDV
jgi:hypothetical protein